jgi:prepilin-type N-terminal cleavage/methylation domain-containing protein
MTARRGMTLMELVVAIALTGMMAAAGAATFASIIDHRRVIRESTVSTERAAALREMVRTWVVSSSIQIQQGGGPRGLTSSTRRSSSPSLISGGVTAAAQTGDELTFTTSAMTPTPSANTRVRMFVDNDPNTDEHGLAIEYQGGNATPLRRMQLDSTIGVLTVEYLDNRTGRWYPSVQAATIQPIAIRFSFAAADGDSIPRLLQLPFVFRMGDPQQQRGR